MVKGERCVKLKQVLVILFYKMMTLVYFYYDTLFEHYNIQLSKFFRLGVLFYLHPQVKTQKEQYNVTPWIPVDSYECFRGRCPFYLKREAVDSSKALVAVCSLTLQKTGSFIVPVTRIWNIIDTGGLCMVHKPQLIYTEHELLSNGP